MNQKDKTRLRKELREKIKSAEDKLEKKRLLLKHLNLVPDLGEGEWSIDASWDYVFTIPWDERAYEDAISLMLASGWNAGKETKLLEYKKKYTHFTHLDIGNDWIWLYVTAKADLEGATCKIQKIGETKEVKEVVTPVYEVTCPESDNPLMPELEAA